MAVNGLAGRTVLVAGGSGFIGSHLVRSLLDAGATVHGVSRSRPPPGNESVTWHAGDLSDPDFVEALGHEVSPDLVYQVAGHVDGSRDLDMVLPTLRGNLLTSVNLLSLAARVDAERVVLAGSMEEPWADGGSGIEGLPPSPYAAAKWAASCYGLSFDRLYGPDVAVARLFMVYGPGQADREKLVPYAITTLLDGQSPELTSGDRKVDWIYVSDAVGALLRLGTRPEAAGRIVDVGSGTRTSVRSVVEAVSSLVGGSAEPSFGRREERPYETERAADLSAAWSLLGWEPEVQLSEGLERTVEWYRRRQA